MVHGAAALACVVVGVGLLLLALDVGRARAAFRDDDVRYRGTPESALWQPAEALPAIGCAVAEAPVLERHNPAFDPKTGQGGLTLWIPLTC